MATPNVHEAAKRHSKAYAISRVIWSRLTREQRIDLSLPRAIREQDQAARDGWARESVQLSPSDATWQLVVEMLEERVHDERRWLSIEAAS